MRKNKAGFLLIEWMIHFLLLSILILVAATLIMSWHKNSISIGRLCDNALSVYLAADVLHGDIHNAYVVTHDAKGVRIEYPHTILSWQHHDNALWRQTSVYQSGSWGKPSKSLFVQHIPKSDFVIKTLSEASQAALVTWHVNETTFLFVSRNGLIL